MRISFILFFSCLIFCAKGSEDIKMLRKLLTESPENEQVAETFFMQTKSFNEKDGALLLGFKAMSEFILCKHVFSVFKKLDHFNAGKKILENAIKKDQKNAELIFFRYTVQTNVPAILAYSAKKEEDKQFLIKYLKDNFYNPNKDVDLYQRIKNYLLQCPDCNKYEKETVKKL